jgi:hypothetical protein
MNKEPLLLLVTTSATIGICVECLPKVAHDMTMTALHMVDIVKQPKADEHL